MGAEHVLNRAVVAERDPHLEAQSHAHPVLAVEQRRQVTREREVADLAHTTLVRIGRGRPGQGGYFGKCPAVLLVQVAGEVEFFDQSGV
ncbi:hypothetical protein X751_16490 [Mesorhizobium sp. LNJC395A00]|nr:hypothetical protein X751_16490 [Mesorhizobium sp. LNJC395A00]